MEMTFTEVEEEKKLKPGSWYMDMDTGTGKPSGKLKMHMTSTGQAKVFEASLNHAPIRIGNQIVAVHIFNSMLHRLPGIVQGKAMGASSPSRVGAPPGLA